MRLIGVDNELKDVGAICLEIFICSQYAAGTPFSVLDIVSF